MKASAYHKVIKQEQKVNKEEDPCLYMVLPFIFTLLILLFSFLCS